MTATATSALDDWARGRGDTLTWLDTDRYVWSVFAGAPQRWYDQPAALAAAIGQAHTVLRSQVHTVDIAASFPGLGSGDTAAICAALELLEPRGLLIETVDALAHRLGSGVDLVLDCPSPRKLFSAAAVEPDFDAQEDVAAALLDVIRAVADRPIRGLQITCDSAAGPDDDEIDCWSSLLAAARYYGWVSAARFDEVTDLERVDCGVPVDLLMFPRIGAEMLPDDRRFGGGLPPAAWEASSDGARLADAAAKRSFRFGEIPHHADPETVLSRIAALS